MSTQMRKTPARKSAASPPAKTVDGFRPKGKTVEEVYLEIKKRIYFSRLAPGQKIVYSDLAKLLGVSVTPVVQALKRLERSTLVTYIPNKGYFVGELTQADVLELYQVREALEIYAVPMIVENLTQKRLESIRRAFREYSHEAGPSQRRMLMIKDAEFHLAILRYAGNRTLYDYLRDIFERIYLRYRPETLSDDRIHQALGEHQAILTALKQKDADKTGRILKDHIQKGREHVLKNIRETDADDLLDTALVEH